MWIFFLKQLKIKSNAKFCFQLVFCVKMTTHLSIVYGYKLSLFAIILVMFKIRVLNWKISDIHICKVLLRTDVTRRAFCKSTAHSSSFKQAKTESFRKRKYCKFVKQLLITQQMTWIAKRGFQELRNFKNTKLYQRICALPLVSNEK